MFEITLHLKYALVFNKLDTFDIIKLLESKLRKNLDYFNIKEQTYITIIDISSNIKDSVEYEKYFNLRRKLETNPSRFTSEEQINNYVELYYKDEDEISKANLKIKIKELYNLYKEIIDNYKFTEEDLTLISFLKNNDLTSNSYITGEWLESSRCN